MVSYTTYNIVLLVNEGWLNGNYNILLTLQERILPIVKYTLFFLAVLFGILLTIYLVSSYVHYRQKRYVEWKTVHCQSLISSLLDGGKSPDDLRLSPRERNCFRDTLITEYSRQGISGKSQIRELYRELKFLDGDVQQLRSNAWWKRIEAMERLGMLELAEAEEYVVPSLADRRSEVRFSALRILASLGSQKLGSMLPEIFADSSRWAYRFLVNTLINTEISVHNLMPLVSSPSRHLRKAAATLLGRQGNNEAIPILRQLAGDKEKDTRRETVRSLGIIGSVEAVPILSDRAADHHPQVRAEVARALGGLKDESALVLLDKLAGDPDFDVRLQAFFALVQFGESGESIIRKYEVKHPEMAQEFLNKNRSVNHAV